MSMTLSKNAAEHFRKLCDGLAKSFPGVEASYRLDGSNGHIVLTVDFRTLEECSIQSGDVFRLGYRFNEFEILETSALGRITYRVLDDVKHNYNRIMGAQK